MNLHLNSRDGWPTPDFSDLMRDLVWAPGYHDTDAWFSPASATAEGIVIHETSGWPTTIAGLGFGEALSAGDESRGPTAGLAEAQAHWLPMGLLRELLDAKAGRLVRGYLAVGTSLPGAHVLSCAFAADTHQRIERYRHADPSASMTAVTTLRAASARFWRHAMSWGPFEFLVVIGFLFETLLADRLREWQLHSLSAWNSGRAALGRDVLHFLLDQDPSNRTAIQGWLDHGAGRCAALFACADDAIGATNPAAVGKDPLPGQSPCSALIPAFAELFLHGIHVPASLAPPSHLTRT